MWSSGSEDYSSESDVDDREIQLSRTVVAGAKPGFVLTWRRPGSIDSSRNRRRIKHLERAVARERQQKQCDGADVGTVYRFGRVIAVIQVALFAWSLYANHVEYCWESHNQFCVLLDGSMKVDVLSALLLPLFFDMVSKLLVAIYGADDGPATTRVLQARMDPMRWITVGMTIYPLLFVTFLFNDAKPHVRESWAVGVSGLLYVAMTAGVIRAQTWTPRHFFIDGTQSLWKRAQHPAVHLTLGHVILTAATIRGMIQGFKWRAFTPTFLAPIFFITICVLACTSLLLVVSPWLNDLRRDLAWTVLLAGAVVLPVFIISTTPQDEERWEAYESISCFY